MIRWLLLAAAVSTAAAGAGPGGDGAPADLRYLRLEAYFAGHPCPAGKKIAQFLEEADEHSLDWRLLPGLAVVETSGGKHVRHRNNWFGWNSGRAQFATVDLGIHAVAQTLAESDLYRDKSLRGVLGVYNHARSYPERVLRVMREIGPAVLEKTSNGTEQRDSGCSGECGSDETDRGAGVNARRVEHVRGPAGGAGRRTQSHRVRRGLLQRAKRLAPVRGPGSIRRHTGNHPTPAGRKSNSRR